MHCLCFFHTKSSQSEVKILFVCHLHIQISFDALTFYLHSHVDSSKQTTSLHLLTKGTSETLRRVHLPTFYFFLLSGLITHKQWLDELRQWLFLFHNRHYSPSLAKKLELSATNFPPNPKSVSFVAFRATPWFCRSTIQRQDKGCIRWGATCTLTLWVHHL